MRRFIPVPLFLLIVLAPAPAADEAIFAPGATLKVEAEGGVADEGPAWHPELGVLTSGSGHIQQLDRKGQSHIYRNKAGKGFEDVTTQAGLDMVFATMGSNFGDFDNCALRPRFR